MELPFASARCQPANSSSPARSRRRTRSWAVGTDSLTHKKISSETGSRRSVFCAATAGAGGWQTLRRRAGHASQPRVWSCSSSSSASCGTPPGRGRIGHERAGSSSTSALWLCAGSSELVSLVTSRTGSGSGGRGSASGVGRISWWVLSWPRSASASVVLGVSMIVVSWASGVWIDGSSGSVRLIWSARSWSRSVPAGRSGASAV